MAESRTSGWRRHKALIPILGLAVLWVSVGIATAGPPEKSTEICDRIPPGELAAAIGEPVALTTAERDGATVRCDFGKPGEPTVLPWVFGVNVAITDDRYAYVPDAVADGFTAVPGLGDAAHYQRDWGLIFRRGSIVVQVEVTLDFYVDPAVDELSPHMAVARVVDDALRATPVARS